MSTAHYGTYYVDHRMEGLRDNIGWDAKRPSTLFRSWSGSGALEIDFIRPARADQEKSRSPRSSGGFRGPDALIECVMVDAAGKELSRCLMTVAYVDKATTRAKDWPADVAALFFEKAAS